jgi:quinol monooxygenase YgiN
MITLIAQFAMLNGKEQNALELVNAAKAQADAEQPGTLLYFVHHVLDTNHEPTNQLLFYECYRDQQALDAHLASTSWKALTGQWSQYFEGTPASIAVTSLDRFAGFVHLEAP